MFYPFLVTTPHIIYALLGAFIVLFGMFSLFLRERLYIGEAIWAFLFGIIIGPYCADIFDPRSWSAENSEEVTNVITLEFTRVVLAIGVFAIGVELPKAYMAKHWRSLLFLLVPVMTWGWFVSAGLVYALIPGLNFIPCLAIGACFTPTDPILAAAVVGGKWADKHVPAHIRHLLAAESGCNDGAAFPFLFLALYLLIDHTTGAALRDWFLLLWLYQVILGSIIGSTLGFSFRYLMKFCQRHDLIDRQSYVAQYLSLAILTIGVCTLLGSDDLLAAFCCGAAFAWDGFFNKQTEESVFSSVIDTLFNVAAFIYVGAWMPFNKFQDADLNLSVWRLIVIAILVLLLRRLPIIIMLYRWIPDIKTFREAVFSGHFGPIGIGAVFISTLALEVLHDAHEDDNPQVVRLQKTIQPIVAFMVLCSITIHGLSIPSFSLGRRVHSVSRTWSRRDTQTSAPPDWTTHTRMVTRGEDIVINRDVGDLERGDAGSVVLEKAGSDNSTHTDETEKLGSSGISDDTKVYRAESPQPRFNAPRQPQKAVSDYRNQIPPDGTEQIAEWIEGSHRIIEKKMGPGSDVEVSVVNNDPDLEAPTTKWRGKVHELEHDAEAIGRTISRQLGNLSARTQEVISPSRRSSLNKEKQKEEGEGARRQAAADDSAIADGDEDDEGWASEGSDDSAPGHRASTSETRRISRSSLSRSSKGVHHPHTAHRPRRRSSIRRNSNAAADIVEELRGRPVTTGDPGVTFETPQRASRPGTATSSRSIMMGPATTRSSRPGTADSSFRHHRLQSIRALHSGPPTRESSPSRSVRFVDEEGRAGGRGIVPDSSGRTLVESSVAEEGS